MRIKKQTMSPKEKAKAFLKKHGPEDAVKNIDQIIALCFHAEDLEYWKLVKKAATTKVEKPPREESIEQLIRKARLKERGVTW